MWLLRAHRSCLHQPHHVQCNLLCNTMRCALTHASVVQGGDKPGTKAIVFSQFWMHIELVVHFLATRSVGLALLKRNLSPAEKAAALARFQVCGAGTSGLPLSGAAP